MAGFALLANGGFSDVHRGTCGTYRTYRTCTYMALCTECEMCSIVRCAASRCLLSGRLRVRASRLGELLVVPQDPLHRAPYKRRGAKRAVAQVVGARREKP